VGKGEKWGIEKEEKEKIKPLRDRYGAACLG
jgi:hypothetical protein